MIELTRVQKQRVRKVVDGIPKDVDDFIKIPMSVNPQKITYIHSAEKEVQTGYVSSYVQLESGFGFYAEEQAGDIATLLDQI